MTSHDPATPPHFEGQEHEFLQYERVVVQFIYSFSWDVTKRSWKALVADLAENGRDSIENCGKGKGFSVNKKGWRERKLHERVFSPDGESLGNCSYQPSLVGRTTVLERAGCVGERLKLVIPIEAYTGTKLKDCETLIIPLRYTIRLFDNGSGTVTFEVYLSKELATFRNIHFVLHLANNVDFGISSSDTCVLTNTFIMVPDRHEVGEDSLIPHESHESNTIEHGYFSLHDLFRKWIVTPPNFCPDNAKELWTDVSVLYTDDLNQDFQSPFVFTVAQIERNSYIRFRKTPTINYVKEVSSILCKLTLDNRHIERHYINLSEDYIASVLPYDSQRRRLMNQCLDRRLFFSISRRGAVAFSSNLSDIPARFVVPSLLNLCEILRARWHLGSIVNIKLDQAISRAAGVDPDVSPSAVMEELFGWRALFAAFFRDPVPFLFDGGSVAEIAEIAEEKMWLAKMRDEVTRKFATLDRMVQDLYARKRVAELRK